MSEESSSLSAQVFQKIRDDILSGRYHAKEELKEKNIGDSLGVSRTPVREALRQLELEGLISIIPNKGAYVIGVCQKDIKDIYEIRSLLEGLCAKWAAKEISEEQLADLEENIYLEKYHAEKENWEQLLDLDSSFHEILYVSSKSRELMHVLKDYHQYAKRVRKISLEYPLRVKKSVSEHEIIFQALKAHNPDAAQKAATEHVKNTIRNLDRIGWDNLIQA